MAFGLFKKKKKEEGSAKAQSQFISLHVNEVVNETEDAISIHFDQPADEKVSYKSGQFFTILANINGSEERRAYSLCSSPFTDEDLAVTVKRVEGGLMSNYLNDNLKAGNTLKLMPPIGNFITEFGPNNQRHIVLFGGGSGITPLISIAKSALDQEPDSKVSLVYANRNINSIIFKSALEDLIEKYGDRFNLLHVLEEASDEMESYEGYVTKEIIENALTRLPQLSASDTEFFTCGPAPMMDIVVSSLASIGIDDSKVHKESFTAAHDKKEVKEITDSNEVIAREVTLIYDDEEFKITVAPDETILERGLDEDIDLPFSCQSGLCTACRGKCVSGKVQMDEDEGLSDAEMAEGFVLPCVSHPLTDDVVIEIG
jgi:ring-1,2-phenylacetyl-CoA epoxidase subunit PaaE